MHILTYTQIFSHSIHSVKTWVVSQAGRYTIGSPSHSLYSMAIPWSQQVLPSISVYVTAPLRCRLNPDVVPQWSITFTVMAETAVAASATVLALLTSSSRIVLQRYFACLTLLSRPLIAATSAVTATVSFHPPWIHLKFRFPTK